MLTLFREKEKASSEKKSKLAPSGISKFGKNWEEKRNETKPRRKTHTVNFTVRRTSQSVQTKLCCKAGLQGNCKLRVSLVLPMK